MQRYFYIAALFAVWVDIHHTQYMVALALFIISDNIIISDIAKGNVIGDLQGSIRLTSSIYAGDDIR